ncbi:MAG TPA: Spy/CpxP family protein refolding chaperone [Reyranella sp.]|jgi:hypothetical protein
MRVRPLFLAVPTALVAAAGLAWLTSAAASNGGIDGVPQIAQATPPAATPPAAGGPERGPGPDRIMPKFSPKSFCEERIARRVGARAYLKEKLDLKADQMSAWDAFQKAADAVSAKEKTRCASLPTEMQKTMPSFADRMNRREDRMKSRLESIEAVKPTLLALYDKLTPDQKAVLDRPMMGRRHGGPGKHWRRG